MRRLGKEWRIWEVGGHRMVLSDSEREIWTCEHCGSTAGRDGYTGFFDDSSMLVELPSGTRVNHLWPCSEVRAEIIRDLMDA